jgi:phage terminase large subunit
MPTRIVQIRLPKLRPLQAALAQAMLRWNVWVCHRRFGKTLLCLCLLLKKAFENPLPSPRYAYIAPLYRQAKAIAWDYLKRFAAQLPDAVTNEAELRLDLPGDRRIQLLGADSPDSIRGVYLDGAVLDEYALMRPRAWTQVVRPALSDRQGWAIKIGTVYGRNHLYEDYQEAHGHMLAGHPDYHAALYRASDTGVIPAEELASARATMRDRRGRTAGDADYLQEYECEWDAPIPGAVYGDELATMRDEQRIGDYPYDPSMPVQTWWDFGWSDMTAIWLAQERGPHVALIDYREGSQQSLVRWVEQMRQLPYVYDHARLGLTRAPYERHYAPHDLAQTEYGYGKTRYTIALEQGWRFTAVPIGPLEDGIEATRALLRRALIHEAPCQRGLDALRSYEYQWDDARQTYGKAPYHNWASHGADALRTGAVGLQAALRPLSDQPPPGSFEWARRQVQRAKRGLPVGTYRVGATPGGR